MSNLKCKEMNLICNDIAWKEKTQRTESILGWRQWGPTIFHRHQSMWPYVCTVTFFLVSMVNHLALQVLPYRDAFQPRSGSLNSAGYVIRFMIYIWDSRWMSAKCEIWPCVTVDIYWHLLIIPLYSTVIMFQHFLLASAARFFASSAKKKSEVRVGATVAASTRWCADSQYFTLDDRRANRNWRLKLFQNQTTFNCNHLLSCLHVRICLVILDPIISDPKIWTFNQFGWIWMNLESMWKRCCYGSQRIWFNSIWCMASTASWKWKVLIEFISCLAHTGGLDSTAS